MPRPYSAPEISALDSYRQDGKTIRPRTIFISQTMDRLLFNGWRPLVHIAVVGLIGYLALILFLRVSGKRTLSRMNAYDMVITMALGSVLTKAMLTEDQSIVETVFAISMLIFFQFMVSFAAYRWRWAAFLATPSPTVLYHDGHFLQDALRRERVRQSEVEALRAEVAAGEAREPRRWCGLRSRAARSVLQGSTPKKRHRPSRC